MMHDDARLLVIEGANNVGKTVLSKKLTHVMSSKGRDVYLTAFPGNQPGTLGQLVYQLHHHPSKHNVESIDPISLQTLHVAAHVDAIRHQILPRLQNGISVILDRFWWSTLIYGQISGIDKQSLEAMLDLEKLHWQRYQPDMLFLIDRHKPFANKPPNWNKLRQAYRRYAKNEKHPHPVKIITNDAPLEQVVDEVVAAADL